MRVFKKISKKINSFFSKYINGSKGVISLFLALLMVPFTSVAAVLLNTARLNSAVALFDEALCNASNSTLGTYDEFLRKRFGLLAMSQDYSSGENSYTAEEFVAELFLYYMEQNLSVISNTYEVTDISASGVYPLADTDVLLTQVLEYSKYTVPAKMVVDGFNLEEILKKLTESLDIVSAIFDTIGAGANMAASFDKCQEDIDAAITKIGEFNTAKQNYENAYTEFKSAVENYNSLIDTAISEIRAKENDVTDAEDDLADCEELLQEEAEKEDVTAVLQQIAAIEQEKEEGKKTVEEATTAIDKIKEDNESVLEAYNEAKEDVEEAHTDLTSAQNALESTRTYYNNQLASRRSTVTTEKSEYATCIDLFAQSAEATGTSITTAQGSIASVINSTMNFAGEVVNVVGTAQENAVEKQIEDIKDSKQEAVDRGDNTAAYLWDDQLGEAEDNKVKVQNDNKLTSTTIDGVKTGVSSLETFASREYYDEYHAIFLDLNGLLSLVQGYVVHNDNTSKLARPSDYYISNIAAPLEAEDIEDLLSEMAANAAGSVLSSIVKAIKGFIEAMTNISLTYDPNLVSVIDESKYFNIGGLPSKKDRTLPQYSLESEYATEDSERSNYYKNLLGAYSNEEELDGSVDSFDVAVDRMMADIDTICTCMDEIAWYNFFSKLGEMWTAVKDMFAQIANIMADIGSLIAGSGIYEKSLLSGYIAYNMSNRTSYAGSALTGAHYSLPDVDNPNQGYAFSGAEVEYLLNGSYSEIENQESVFDTIFFIRFVMNIPYVFMNTEVGSIAAQAGAPTFGIGTIVVYALYLFAEPMLDTIIVVNGGQVPIIKMKIYLTPSGIVSLVQAMVNLKLNSEQKNTAYKAVVETMTDDKTYAENYADALSAFGTASSPLDKISFDYTKSIMLLLMFKNADTLLLRMSDIIQMECTYNAINMQYSTYTFDLDKSFTYIRSSGTFTATPFIRISDAVELTTSERIVYRGY